MMPVYELTGFDSYVRLFAQPSWYMALTNLSIFGSLYIGISIAIGLALAILIDQRIRGEGVLRPIYLYPMALSFIVTGTAWKWFLNPGFGLEKTMHAWGWESFKFDWLINTDMAIYTIVIAGVWQTSGFVMATEGDSTSLGRCVCSQPIVRSRRRRCTSRGSTLVTVMLRLRSA
jgi:glucose/mannose transport system permease protein